MNMDPKAILHEAVLRGATHTELLNAAAACARAVIRLMPADNPDAIAVVAAVERWAMEACHDMPYVAGLAEKACQNLRDADENWTADENDSSEVWAVLSAAMAGLACHPDRILYEFAAELCVDYACKAAAKHGIDLAPIVTAELL